MNGSAEFSAKKGHVFETARTSDYAEIMKN